MTFYFTPHLRCSKNYVIKSLFNNYTDSCKLYDGVRINRKRLRDAFVFFNQKKVLSEGVFHPKYQKHGRYHYIKGYLTKYILNRVTCSRKKP